MSRPLRIEYPGACYHVMNRGNGGEYVLKTKEDKRKFLEYLGKVRERFGVFIHAYCLMGNHYHLLAETPEPNLSRAIQWLNVSYATWYNRRKGRSGHLFQGRFKSILIDKGAYLKELSRYIHRNPVRAGMVKAPQQYAWSSYRVYIGQAKAPAFLETDWLLGQFGKTRQRAFERYRDFVNQALDDPRANPRAGIAGGLILGTGGIQGHILIINYSEAYFCHDPCAGGTDNPSEAGE